MRKITLVATIALSLVGAGVAGATAVTRYYSMQKGDQADFVTPGHWSCLNRGAVVTCSSGDAFPTVDLLLKRPGGLTVRVHILAPPQSGRMVRSVDRYGRPVYTFSAL